MATPRFAQSSEAARPASRRVWLWPMGLLMLLAALFLNIVLADRHRLASDAQWRPSLETLCALLRCTLPAWHQPTAFAITARDIRPHPTVPGALLLTASFRNEAAFAQQWPQLEVALTDIDDQAFGLRRFQASEYLGREPASEQILPQQSASITLEIHDPGKHAVAFRLDFY